jgi:hypothetical protein
LLDLWARADKAAVFMCGLSYSRGETRPEILVASVPLPVGFNGKPRYWTNLVVRADSQFRALLDTFGHRLALTVKHSQSGYVAPLRLLATCGGSEPLYGEVIAPRVTPVGAITCDRGLGRSGSGRRLCAPAIAVVPAGFDIPGPGHRPD